MYIHSKKRVLIKALIFIMIGSVSIMFAELVIFNGKRSSDPSWLQNNFLRHIYSEPSIDVSELKSQHAKYMEQGISLPNTINPASINFPGAITTAKTEIVPINLELKANDLSAIEPALGTEGNIGLELELIKEPPSTLDMLELGIKSIEEVYARRNLDDVIFNLDDDKKAKKPRPEVKEEKTASLNHIINDSPKSDITKAPYEEYTHAPIDTPDLDNDKSKGLYVEPQGGGKIAIIIDDMGLSLRSRIAEELPGPLTLSYLPYAENLDAHAKRAKANGHELMVHMPMEPMNRNLDGGPHVLKVSQSKEELIETLDWGLSQFDGYVGINNHMGSRTTADKRSMDHVMKELKKRGLFFVDSRTIGSSVAAKSANEAGIPYAVRDIFLDHEVNPEFINQALAKLENKANSRGYAIAIGHPHKDTINALKEWLPTLKEKGLTLVPVSALLKHPSNKEDIATNN